MLKRALTDVVNAPGGTGGAARVEGVLVAGKTGTAQNPHGKDHSWFACFAPAERPLIAIAVLVVLFWNFFSNRFITYSDVQFGK